MVNNWIYDTIIWNGNIRYIYLLKTSQKKGTKGNSQIQSEYFHWQNNT